MNKAKCFISYCSDDSKPKEVKIFVEYLEKLSNKKSYPIDFLFDKNLKIGNDLNKFMNEIKNVDSIIVLCSPSYKKKYENLDGKYSETGTFKEATLIKERMKDLNNLSVDLKNPDEDNLDLFTNSNFSVFPLVFKMNGDSSSNSVPDFLSHLYREKINNISFDTFENKEQITQYYQKNYKDIFMDIIINTSIIHSQKSQWLDMPKKDLLQRLVYNHKAESAPPLDSGLFVKTYYYDQIHTQGSYFMIGRKGSGKTTAKQYFYQSHINDYKGIIDLRINTIGMDNIFNYLVYAPYDANTNLSSEIENIFTYEKVFNFIWYLYIYLYSFYLVACECIREKPYISPSQKKNFNAAIRYINSLLLILDPTDRWNNNENISSIIYAHSMERVVHFCNEIIVNSRNSSFFNSDIIAQFNYNKLINSVFGKKTIESFYRGLHECDRRILLSVDGFDDAFDIFRQGSLSASPDNRKKRGIFQVRWISELLELIRIMKDSDTNPLFKLIDVCFLIPKDQFIEILSINRDRYKYNTKFCEISWSGIELAIMVRKRIEIIENIQLSEDIKKEKQPEELLNIVLGKAFPNLPLSITVKTKQGLSYTIPLFLYMLRYSFWRPRDILLELYLILNIIYNHTKTGIQINETTLKAAIKHASTITVASEFYSEFKALWPDIKDNIDLFTNSKLVLSKEELKDIIMSSKFQIKLSVDDEIIDKFDEKVRFLYEIGFLGILVNETYRSKYQMVTNQGFSFSEGMNCIKGVTTEDFLDCSYLINPSFIEDLNLNVNTEEYIGISNWNQLKELENMLQIRMKTSTFDCISQYIYKYRPTKRAKANNDE